MSSNIEKSITIIVRTTGESTTEILVKQLQKQITEQDSLLIIDKEECFEDKLKNGFKLGVEENKAFTVFIDADILLRHNAIKKIKKLTNKLKDSDLGFGLRLWDRFYDRPKFRGLHVYRTNLLEKAILYVPEPNVKLRPESFTKQKMKEDGHDWRNGISFYVAGIHDFFQNSEDIYYKFLIRSKRSRNDLFELKKKFRLARETDYKIALQGILDGEQMTDITNNKFLYKNTPTNLPKLNLGFNHINKSTDLIIIKKLIKHYRINRLFWKSI
ncbi:hypothetical protein [Winogradskyella bathintestinalis]|uniref:Glycosyltransferase n=1 Tax=Winogradskyella bathintestinalis TaxID=3035208 RepID=A0ABT7ZTS1_9FLAO|nr:hypothetical protein [Winogradskyella bathintestinalis]MDN3492421.1 hypothetical protein [Winogradskyella bathintestinalis]